MNAGFIPHGNSEPNEPRDSTGRPVPAEPFAYMSRAGGSRPKIRSPWGLFCFGVFLLVAGIGALILAVVPESVSESVPESVPSGGAIAAGVFVLVIFGGLGIATIIMAVKRIRWKRQYTKVTGHGPW